MEEWKIGLPKLQDAYKAWDDSKGGSIDTWLALMADGVDFRSLANGQEHISFTKPRSSREEVRGYLTGLTSTFKMEFYRVERFVCQDNNIVMVGNTAWVGIRTGKRFETPKVDVWQFRNGEAISFFEYYDTAKVAEAAKEPGLLAG